MRGLLQGLVSACVLLALPLTVSAELKSITIKDCDNKTRLVDSIEDDQKVSVQAILEDVVKDDSFSVVIKNKSADLELSKQVSSNLVKIDNVTAGDWVICSEPTEIAFKDISIVKEGSQISTAGTIAGVSAAGALAVLVGSSSGSSSDKSAAPADDSSSQSEAANQNPESETKLPSLNEDSGSQAKDPCHNQRSGDRASSPCFIGDDEDITPISPFS